MITANSLSGGRTSSFMGLHFPADHDIFACVEQEAYKYTRETALARDKIVGLNEAQDWLRMFHPGFWMSAEDDLTLVAMHKLTQDLGLISGHGAKYGKIQVVFAHNWGKTKYKTYDDIVKDFLPNSGKRLCTEVLKIEPMYNYIRSRISKVDPVEMRLGFRIDELDRTVNIYFKQVDIKDRVPNPSFDMQAVINMCKIPDYLVRWWDIMDIEGSVKKGERVFKKVPFNYYKSDYYRIPSFPLIEHGVTHAEIVKYWKGRPDYVFPKISNCVMCFHHKINELQQQWANKSNWNRMQWADDAEKSKPRRTFKREKRGKKSYPMPMEKILSLPIQMQIDFIDFATCDSGTCTD